VAAYDTTRDADDTETKSKKDEIYMAHFSSETDQQLAQSKDTNAVKAEKWG